MWTASDWLLQGHYCPEEEIYSLLEGVRADVQADRLIHLAVDRTALLRSLTFVVPRDKASTQIENAVRVRQVDGSRTPLSRAGRRLASNQSSNGLDATLRLALAEALASEVDLVTSDHLGFLSLGYEHAPIRSVLITIGGASREAFSAATEQDLAAMVNATPQAESRRDSRWMEHAKSLPAYPDFNDTDFSTDFQRLATAMLELARRVADAVTAALYMTRATDSSQLLFTASVAGEGLTEIAYPTAVQVSSSDLDISDVLERQKSIQRRIAPTLAPLVQGTPAAGAELLCPVPWTSASPEGPAAGVMVLHRFPEGRSFTAYNLALVRNVCLRLALHRNASAAGHIAAAVSHLRRGTFNERDPAPVAVPGGFLPSDVCMALNRISAALPTLAEATESHSVSLRLALPNGQCTDAHGLALVRVAAFPEEELHRPEVVQTQDEGANWTVVRMGRAVVIADTDLASVYTAYRAKTRSELSVPVRSEGRLIGVLNLESPYLDHYAALTPLVEAFAAGVGRTLVDSVADHARSTLARALTVDSLTHDLKKNIDEAIVGFEKAGARGESMNRLRDAQRVIDRIRAESEQQVVPALVLPKLLRAAAGLADLVSFDPARGLEEELQDIVCTASQVNALLPALHSLFVNIKDHSSVAVTTGGPPPAPESTVSLVQYDGASHVALCIANRAGVELDPQVVADLYRVPVVGTRRPGRRLGAYLAGTRLKAVRGILCASLSAKDPDVLRTHLLFPVVPMAEV